MSQPKDREWVVGRIEFNGAAPVNATQPPMNGITDWKVAASTCQKCHKRPATETWCGDGGTLAFVHGMYQRWCNVCVLTEQLAHARKMAASIPELEAQLTAAQAGTST